MKNVTRLYALLATALMITTIVTTSDAQRGPGGGGQGGPQQGGPGGGGGMRQRNQQSGPMYIIKMPTVQAHLNLTQAQKDSIAALRPPQGGPQGGGPGGGGQGGPQGGGPGGGGQGGPQGGGPGGPGGNGGERPNPLAEILNENQMNRLNQLALQFDAPMSILDRKSAHALALTEAQRTQLDTIIKNAFPRPQGGPGGGQGGPGGNGGGQGGPGGPGGPGGGQGGNRPTPPTFAEMQAKKAAAFNLAWEVLNGTQKDKWNTMTGAKFTNWVEVPRPNN